MSQTIRIAATWMVGARVLDRALGTISIAILARALTPEDFGLVAMAAAVVAIAEVFAAFGFDWAVIRQQAPTREHFNTAWTLRIIVCSVVALILAGSAYPVAMFYARTELFGVILIMAVNVMVGAFENIWVVEFRRNFRFDSEFWFKSLGKFAGFVVGIVIALATHSFWALVLGATAARVATTWGSYLMHPNRPSFGLSKSRDLLSFSGWLMVGSAVNMVRARFGDAFIGRAFGARSLGLFSVAEEVSSLATTEFAAPINRVVYSRYAQIGNDVVALKENFLRVSSVIWGVGIPASVGIAATAPQVVSLLLGDQWDQSVPLIRILAVAGGLTVMGGNTAYVYWAVGRFTPRPVGGDKMSCWMCAGPSSLLA